LFFSSFCLVVAVSTAIGVGAAAVVYKAISSCFEAGTASTVCGKNFGNLCVHFERVCTIVVFLSDTDDVHSLLPHLSLLSKTR
jgi:hypothetical protein